MILKKLPYHIVMYSGRLDNPYMKICFMYDYEVDDEYATKSSFTNILFYPS